MLTERSWSTGKTKLRLLLFFLYVLWRASFTRTRNRSKELCWRNDSFCYFRIKLFLAKKKQTLSSHYVVGEVMLGTGLFAWTWTDYVDVRGGLVGGCLVALNSHVLSLSLSLIMTLSNTHTLTWLLCCVSEWSSEAVLIAAMAVQASLQVPTSFPQTLFTHVYSGIWRGPFKCVPSARFVT